MGFNSGRRGVVACRMGSSLSRLGEHNGLVVDAVGMVDDLDAADMNGTGRYRAVETADERRIEVDTAPQFRGEHLLDHTGR